MKRLIVIVSLLFIVLLSGCTIGQVSPQIVKEMIEIYSDDQNYVALSGEVMEFDDYGGVTIKCEEISTYIPYQSSICSYHIFSEEILNLNAGDYIDFVTVPEHFFDGHDLPIVEVKMNGDILLNIYNGKDNLMKWVKSLNRYSEMFDKKNNC